MNYGNFFKTIILASLIVVPVRAGIISGIVTAPIGIGSTALGIGLALKAFEQYGNTHGSRQYTSKVEGWGSKFLGSNNKVMQMIQDGENEANSKFGKYATTIAYGTGSAVCLIVGAKILL